MTTIMFEPTIHLQASNGQKQKWLPLSETGQIIGAYVSTELGHGSFVRGMETTATYDEKTDEFIINSPTVSSTKFWPGASGFSCTHAIVTARLTIRGKDYGPHFFMVQFRRLEDGTPLPGITSGDIGLKMGYNGTCNGYTRFENVRIPREDMLSKHAQVDRCGNYKGSQPPQVAHATLLMVRSIIVRGKFEVSRFHLLALLTNTFHSRWIPTSTSCHNRSTVLLRPRTGSWSKWPSSDRINDHILQDSALPNSQPDRIVLCHPLRF